MKKIYLDYSATTPVKEDVVKDLLSYIVGCSLGRYSPYKNGLQFAGGEFDWFSFLVNPFKGAELYTSIIYKYEH